MGEADKIRKFIERHKDVLEVCGVDVAESSINGEWFVYYYNRQYHTYEFFIRFDNVKELVDILLQEMEFKLRCTIEEECATPECEAENISDQIEVYMPIRTWPHDFEACISFIKENGLDADSKFFDTLKELLKQKMER